MFSLNDELFNNQNIILCEVVSELEKIQKDFNNQILINRISDIIKIVNNSIKENQKKFDEIIKQIEELKSKIDNLAPIEELKSKIDNLTKNINFWPKRETKYYPEGRYEGEIVNGKREGKGKFYYNNDEDYMGKVYDGEWKNDMREGRGIETWPDGERFEGYFINDLRNGKGFIIIKMEKGMKEVINMGKKKDLDLLFIIMEI